MLIALAITAALLSATMVALDASFRAYQATTEVASTHTIARLSMHRMLALIRTGQEFGPYPADPTISVIESDFIEFVAGSGEIWAIEFVADDEALYVVQRPGELDEERYLLLEGVIPQPDPDDPDEHLPPFTLEYELGRKLYRCTIDLTIVPDDNMNVDLDGNGADELRLVASAMPRVVMYE
jgi:hypothetical protein